LETLSSSDAVSEFQEGAAQTAFVNSFANLASQAEAAV